MSYSIYFVAEKALKKATGETAQLRIELVIRKTGFNRLPKALQYSVNTKEWDNKRKRLKSSSSSAVELNPLLDAMQSRLEKQAFLWEIQGTSWTPNQLRDSLKENQNCISGTNEEIKYWIDYQINYFSNKERLKNGEVLKGSSNSRNYQWLKNTLEAFTLEVYKKDLSVITFCDITKDFLRAYCKYIQEKAREKGNKGGLRNKISNLKAVFRKALENDVEGINMNIFSVAKGYLASSKTTPKTISKYSFERIRDIDRSLLSKKECFWLDLFLFSYYTGGMANVDVCYLNKSCLKDSHIEYERHKCIRKAYPAYLVQAKEIVNRYNAEAYDNYVFPIFSHKQKTDKQKSGKVERVTLKVNKTLVKICSILYISEKVTWYSARGTYITNMLNSGIPAHLVGDQAGNSPRIIEKHYYHIVENERKGVAEKIRQAI
ncbi:phage integrase SAM-like domain-containing protein [Dysgonomonas sp. Marseille-P4361]|uniref:phage integrase SAM-like domain-containing protein n=1 Tax=Dysgonomonas sp. Marseille-P4361 TaxID=2161820 RepID=UPI000D55A4F7|nr:phage integrase SAM-like domain-containing protein [Dysgonomonas sp. Marseille-P4361]